MSANITTFEVNVEVQKKGSERHRPISYCGTERTSKKPIWVFAADKIIRMFQVDARTGRQAMRKAERYGRPISARKVDKFKIIGDIENLPLNQPSNPYESAMAMDEMIWDRKNKNRKKYKTRKEQPID